MTSKLTSRCSASVNHDGWREASCSRAATTDRLDHPVCTRHAKMYDKWASTRDYEGIKSMTKFWWHWRSL